MKKEYKTLAFIMLVAYVLQGLPYLLGYTIPISPDALHDLMIAEYTAYYKTLEKEHHYARFPVLHVFLAAIDWMGWDAKSSFRYVPQIFPALGVGAFYFFLKQHFPKKQSLTATFLVATFGPRLYWSGQPTRETFGLFFFPILVYLFDSELRKPRPEKKLFLIVSSFLMMASHHWSALMLLAFWIFYTILFVEKDKLLYAIAIIINYALFMIVYWVLLFPFIFVLMKKPLEFCNCIILAIMLFTPGVYLAKKLDFRHFKKKSWMLVFTLIFIGFILFIKRILPFYYPPQVWLMFITYAVFLVVGFYVNRDEKADDLLKINMFFMLFMIAPLLYSISTKYISYMAYDPLRVMEFIIFPLAITLGYGAQWIVDRIPCKHAAKAGAIYMFIVGTFIYPSIFIYGSTFEDTPFYDIRGEIRYLPDEGMELINRAHELGFKVYTTNHVFRMYQVVWGGNELRKELILKTVQDEAVNRNYDKVNDPILTATDRTAKIMKLSSQSKLFLENEWGRLYTSYSCDNCSVMLITIEGLRPDHMSYFGHERNTTLNLDLRGNITLAFTKAFAHSSWPDASLASILNSRLPTQMNYMREEDEYNPEQFNSLADYLNERGYRTAAFNSDPALDYSVISEFQSIHNPARPENQDAAKVVDEAIKWLDKSDGRFMALVNLGEISPPYDYREGHNFTPEDSEFRDPRDYFPTYERIEDGLHTGCDRREIIHLGVGELEQMKKNYDGEISYIDSQIGRLLEYLEDARRMDTTIVVLASTNGQEFLEHGGYLSGCQLYSDTTHVPLMLMLPGMEASNFSKQVGLHDIYPTISYLLDVEGYEEEDYVGQSLQPLIVGKEWNETPLFAATGYRSLTDKYSVINGSEKAVTNDMGERVAYFYLRKRVTDDYNMNDIWDDRRTAGIDHLLKKYINATPQEHFKK